MSRKRKYTTEQYVEAVGLSISWAEVHRRLGLKYGGGTYVYLQSLAKILEIDTSHLKGQRWAKGVRNRTGGNKKELNAILVENSQYSTHYLKLRLIKEGIKEHRCEECNLTEWNNKPIPIQLHHLSGVRTDNRLENLAILCPNCHAQTDTYCAKNKKPA